MSESHVQAAKAIHPMYKQLTSAGETPEVKVAPGQALLWVPGVPIMASVEVEVLPEKVRESWTLRVRHMDQNCREDWQEVFESMQAFLERDGGGDD